MKARHIIGIVILALAVLFFGPMVISAGMRIENIPASYRWFGLLLFGLPAGFLVGVGALIVGPGYRLLSAAWALIAGALYGGLLLVSLLPMMSSPEWQEMMNTVQAQQGGPELELAMASGPAFMLTGLLAVFGVAGLIWARQRRPGSEDDAQSVATATINGSEPGRPLSVSIISILLVVTSLVGLVGWIINYGMNSEAVRLVEEVYGEQASWQLWAGPVMLGISILCGIFLWFGANWARWLLVGSLVVSTTLGALSMRSGWFIPMGLAWMAVYGYFLFYREPARRWFGGSATPPGPTLEA